MSAKPIRIRSVEILGACGVSLVLLKLGGLLHWSWWWVTAPFWLLLPFYAVVWFLLWLWAQWLDKNDEDLK